ncbi:MAG: aminotransferase class I/II-fold pyridoxal phosphate-dependent enzyme [Acidimicrobiia bacterium]
MSIAKRLQPFGVTIFTEITELANAHDAINLGQGFPNWDGPDFIKEAAAQSMTGGHDQYPASSGVPDLRAAIARRYGPLLGRDIDPGAEVTVTTGCTEALAASFLGLVDAGDEVVIIEPFYDTYPVNVALAGAVPRFVTLRPPDFRLNTDDLEAAFSPQTKAVLVNTPHNPTGKVFSAEELETVAALCNAYDALAISDEVYEWMTYEPDHLRLATFDGMGERTITLSSLGKTYSLTGWKVGWAIAPPDLTRGVRSAHQFLTFTTPTPVQHGAVAALQADESFYEELRASYRARRDLLVEGLADVGLNPFRPEGTYFAMADHTGFGFEDDRAFCRHLITECGVAAIPPSVFYHAPSDGASLVRFSFSKDLATLREAIERLHRL